MCRTNADTANGTWSVTFSVDRESYSKIDWDNFYLTVTTIYCTNPDHCYLYGEVVSYDLDTVLGNCNFTEEQRELFEIYYLQIKSLMGE